ncbi:hypothetical protein B0O99DRAFT_652096 [Bisporella sp. PMI_857]|nr:hypothetical protein B0O99DRAFT_652096 [Bisporella sp. PMI_857]
MEERKENSALYTGDWPGASVTQLRPGAYAATLTFKPDTEEIDLVTLEKHVVRLGQAGLSGITSLNSERSDVIRIERQSFNDAGFEQLPVIVGASAHSVFETIKLCHEATTSGADYVLVLLPSYYKAAMTEDAIFNFYEAVAAASPFPLILYSFTAVVAGINMSSDLLIRISKACKNVIGTKFTCSDTDKLARVARAMDAAVAGLVDFALQALVVEKKLDEASAAQTLLSERDWAHTSVGIGATKSVLQHYFSYGSVPRLPLCGIAQGTATLLIRAIESLIKLENSL